MPRLSLPEKQTAKVEFVLSVPLDLMNAMYFTHLVKDAEEIGGWPAEVRKEMSPELLAELDFLFSFPKGQPGVMGQFGDHLWAHPETWSDVDSMLGYLRGMPAGMGEPPFNPGLQGLVLYTAFWNQYGVDQEVEPASAPRDSLIRQLKANGVDPEPALALFDNPEQLRSRMIALIERFYEEHYKADLPRRMPLLEASYEAHRTETNLNPAELSKKLSARNGSCLDDVCVGPFEKLYFAPSLDMGPYLSCSDLGTIHGLVYPCESGDGDEAESQAATTRLARVYKALGDEQRLGILKMLHGREMYVQEIVERTGLRQSVVSRHLSLMAAVGLLVKRREGSMKYLSINPEMHDTLAQTIDLFKAPMPEPASTREG